jgi:hypothetical protein
MSVKRGLAAVAGLLVAELGYAKKLQLGPTFGARANYKLGFLLHTLGSAFLFFRHQ